MGLRGSLEYRFCCIYYLCLFVFVFVFIFAFTLAFVFVAVCVVVVVVFPTTEFGGFRSW